MLDWKVSTCRSRPPTFTVLAAKTTMRASSTGRMCFSTAPTPSSSFGIALRCSIEYELSSTSTTWRGTSTLLAIGSTEVTFAVASARVTAKSVAVNPSTGSCLASSDAHESLAVRQAPFERHVGVGPGRPDLQAGRLGGEGRPGRCQDNQ